MLVGVVSDTHNRVGHVKEIVNLFNQHMVSLVVHTGDITNSKTLNHFSNLNCPLKGVYGNNDLDEIGLAETSLDNGFDFRIPPYIFSIKDKKIAVFHEPDPIKPLLEREKDIDLVLHGHTHRYRNEDINGVKFFNPGESAGIQKGKNAIGIVEIESLEIIRIFF